MRRAHANPHREVADGEVPGAMDAQRPGDAETPYRLLDDAFTFAHRELGVGLVLETRDELALVVIADPTLECHVAPASRIRERAGKRRGLERDVT